MPRIPLLALLAGALLLPLAAAPAAHADDRIIALDVIADHDVVWDYRSGDPKDVCSNWTKGSGTQSLRIRTDRRERMRLERFGGSVLLSGVKPGTFHGMLDRIGRWKEHLGQVAPPCTPCGPLSEYGECGPEPEQPKPLKFNCGERPVRSPLAFISYRDMRGIPSLDKGIAGNVVLTKELRPYTNCPPNLPRSHESHSLVNEWPEPVDLPKADTARIAKLGVGDSVVSEVTVQRSYVDGDGKVTKGERCAGAPDVKSGYSECAVTTFSFTFTRLS